ncbi:hypothetical protein GY45DRAFT_1432114 [Cubamyces sp. BRFM 1775]|nr:hypothetical protein GY45DRAFT_1432114 [Cubamyces sp. BRFM 1775]
MSRFIRHAERVVPLPAILPVPTWAHTMYPLTREEADAVLQLIAAHQGILENPILQQLYARLKSELDPEAGGGSRSSILGEATLGNGATGQRTSPRGVPHLPAEVTDQIIFFVWPDRQALCQCALTCRAWLPASRHQLFREVEICSTQAYDALVCHVLHSDAMRPWLASVRRVRVVHPFIPKATSMSLGIPGGPSDRRDFKQGHRFIHEFAGHLPNLQSLVLTGIDWLQCTAHPSLHLVLASFSRIEALALDFCRFISFNAFRRLIVALPALRALSVVIASWPTASPPPMQIGATHSPVPRLALTRPLLQCMREEGCSRTILEWLSTTPSRETLRSVSFPPQSAMYHHTFLRSLSSSIRTLELGLPRDGSAIPWPLSHFSHLESLKIYMCSKIAAPGLRWDLMPTMLKEVQPSLRTLSFHMYINLWLSRYGHARYSHGFDERNLHRLDAFFQDDRFVGLRSLEFLLDVSPLPQKDEYEAEIAAVLGCALPDSYARGIVAINLEKGSERFVPAPSVRQSEPIPFLQQIHS